MANEIDRVTCMVAIAESVSQIIHRGEDNPVTHPEVEVLRELHGPDSVSEVEYFDSVERTERDEMNRLRGIYGLVVDKVYPGRNPGLEMRVPGRRTRKGSSGASVRATNNTHQAGEDPQNNINHEAPSTAGTTASPKAADTANKGGKRAAMDDDRDRAVGSNDTTHKTVTVEPGTPDNNPDKPTKTNTTTAEADGDQSHAEAVKTPGAVDAQGKKAK